MFCIKLKKMRQRIQLTFMGVLSGCFSLEQSLLSSLLLEAHPQQGVRNQVGLCLAAAHEEAVSSPAGLLPGCILWFFILVSHIHPVPKDTWTSLDNSASLCPASYHEVDVG